MTLIRTSELRKRIDIVKLAGLDLGRDDRPVFGPTAGSGKRRVSKRLVIIDTRQEFHGFANGEPISWFAADNHNWGNVEKPADIIPAKEAKKLAKLPTKFPFGLTIQSGSVVKGKASSAPPKVLDFGEVKIETEEELVKRKGAAYLRIPTPDHARPTDAEIDKLVSELRNVAHTGDVHLHVHCRGGMGRTTLLMTLADMLHNSDKVQCAQIIERQVRSGCHFLDGMARFKSTS